MDSRGRRAGSDEMNLMPKLFINLVTFELSLSPFSATNFDFFSSVHSTDDWRCGWHEEATQLDVDPIRRIPLSILARPCLLIKNKRLERQSDGKPSRILSQLNRWMAFSRLRAWRATRNVTFNYPSPRTGKTLPGRNKKSSHVSAMNMNVCLEKEKKKWKSSELRV